MASLDTYAPVRRSALFELRAILWLILTAILFYRPPTAAPGVWLLATGFLASCILLLAFPARWLKSPTTGYVVFFVDMAGLTAVFYSSSGIHSDSLLLWYLTVFIATVGEDLKKSVGAALVVAALYFWQHMRTPGGLMSDTQALLHIPLFFATATSCGYLAQEARSRELSRRRRTEQALEASHERYRELTEFANDIIVTWDLEGNITSLNMAGEKTTGYSAEEALEMKIFDFFLPEGGAAVRQISERLAAGEKQGVLDLEMLAKDGRHIPLEVNTRLILEAGRPAGVQGIAQDISGRRKAESALQRSEAKYRLLFERNPQPVWVYDSETRTFLAVNEAAVRRYGYSKEEFLAMTLDDVVAGEEISAPPEGLAPASPTWERPGEWKHRKKNGSIIDVEITSHAVEFAGRRCRLVVAEDVTARKQAEASLRATNQTLHTLIQASPLAILATDEAGMVRSWNPAAERVFGWEELEALGQPLELFIEDEETGNGTLYQRALRGEVISNSEFLGRKKDGAKTDLHVSAAPLRDAQGMCFGVVILAADVTERKQLELQFRQAQKMDAVGRLAGGVAHDFNNLLTIIGGYSELVLATLGAEDTRHAQVSEIKQAADRAASLTRQLLAFSRREVLAPQILDLNSTVANIQKMLRRLIGEDIQLITVAAGDLHSVKVDAGLLEQAILNLVVNARDAMPQGGRITIETADVHLDESPAGEDLTVPPGPYVMLAVSDTGTGMDAETRSHIFEPFFTTKEKGKGTGLGLAVVYGFVKQSNGTIRVTSKPGGGTTFRMYLPAVAERSVFVLPPSGGDAARRNEGTETILLVEDEESVRLYVTRILESRGYSVLVAANPEEAIRISMEHAGKIHLLLTDVVMPVLNGQHMAKYLEFWFPKMKVLYMSGYPADSAGRFGGGELEGAFLPKPFTADDLAGKVRDLLDVKPHCDLPRSA